MPGFARHTPFICGYLQYAANIGVFIMYKFFHSLDKKLGKIGIALGLAGVSATAVACYGPPANIKTMAEEAMTRYAQMCDGGSCETYCQTTACAEYGNTLMEPCDRNKFRQTLDTTAALKVCNDQWRVDIVQCESGKTEYDGKQWICTKPEEQPQNNVPENTETPEAPVE